MTSSKITEAGSITISEPVEQPRIGPWKCFHCDESFDKAEDARLHFGPYEHDRPFCSISPEHFRWMEAQHRRNVDEDSEALRAIGRLTSEHEKLRREAEELGYARGLRDAKKYPSELGLVRADATEPSDIERSLHDLVKAINSTSWSVNQHNVFGKYLTNAGLLLDRLNEARRVGS